MTKCSMPPSWFPSKALFVRTVVRNDCLHESGHCRDGKNYAILSAWPPVYQHLISDQILQLFILDILSFTYYQIITTELCDCEGRISKLLLFFVHLLEALTGL